MEQCVKCINRHFHTTLTLMPDQKFTCSTAQESAMVRHPPEGALRAVHTAWGGDTWLCSHPAAPLTQAVHEETPSVTVAEGAGAPSPSLHSAVSAIIGPEQCVEDDSGESDDFSNLASELSAACRDQDPPTFPPVVLQKDFTVASATEVVLHHFQDYLERSSAAAGTISCHCSPLRSFATSCSTVTISAHPDVPTSASKSTETLVALQDVLIEICGAGPLVIHLPFSSSDVAWPAVLDTWSSACLRGIEALDVLSLLPSSVVVAIRGIKGHHLEQRCKDIMTSLTECCKGETLWVPPSLPMSTFVHVAEQHNLIVTAVPPQTPTFGPVAHSPRGTSVFVVGTDIARGLLRGVMASIGSSQ